MTKAGPSFTLRELSDHLAGEGTLGSWEPADESDVDEGKQAAFMISSMGVALDVRITMGDPIKVEWRGTDEDGEEVDDGNEYPVSSKLATPLTRILAPTLLNMMRDDEDEDEDS